MLSESVVIEDPSGAVVIGVTNILDRYMTDDALLRPGRSDGILRFSLPNKYAHAYQKKPIDNDINQLVNQVRHLYRVIKDVLLAQL